MTKLPSVKITTPLGVLYWVNVAGEGKFNELSGKQEYTVTLRLSGKAKDQIIEMIEQFWKDFAEKLQTSQKGKKKPIEPKSLGYKIVYDSEGNPTGEIDVVFKSQVYMMDKNTGEQKKREIYVADKKGKKITDQDILKKIGNGSIGRVSGIMAIYQVPKIAQYGVTFYLQGLQIAKLVEWDGGVDFDEIEGFEEEGFEVEEGFAPVKEEDDIPF